MKFIYEELIRLIAAGKFSPLRFLDGHKTTIFRIVQLINAVLVYLFMYCPYIPEWHGYIACDVTEIINGHWIALSTILGQIGLEIGIQDAKIKAKRGL